MSLVFQESLSLQSEFYLTLSWYFQPKFLETISLNIFLSLTYFWDYHIIGIL